MNSPDTQSRPAIMGTSLFPPRFLKSQTHQLVNPFTSFYTLGYLEELSGKYVGELSLPRNTPIFIPLLAKQMEDINPLAALHINPVDPREFLALYEAWSCRVDGSFTPLTRSTLPHLGASEKRRLLDSASARVHIDPLVSTQKKTFTEAVSDWRSMEERLFMSGAGPAGDLYLDILSLSTSLETEFLPQISLENCQTPASMESQRNSGKTIAIFGDWLLGGDLFRTLENRGFRVVFVQKIFDFAQGNGDDDIDSVWWTHFCFRSMSHKMALYRSTLSRRDVDLVICLLASFSQQTTIYRSFLSRIDLPGIYLESDAPGYLSEQNRNRLETFLKSHS